MRVRNAGVATSLKLQYLEVEEYSSGRRNEIKIERGRDAERERERERERQRGRAGDRKEDRVLDSIEKER
jgi:hypothetical protein